MDENDISAQLQKTIKTAADNATPLCIVGGDSKRFYGRSPVGEPLEVGAHRGILNFAPTELVVTARAGTRLRSIEETLAKNNQMLAFEPPSYGADATLGGTIACNLSGPRRAFAGAARDFMLGAKVLNGKGEILRFGGEVMKNVAGYDVSRLMTGAMGTLGVLLEVSLKVLPLPENELTLVQEIDAARAIEKMHTWARLPLPLSATCYSNDKLYLRLSGASAAISAARNKIGGEELTQARAFWYALKEQRNPFFNVPLPLWRLSLASDTPPIDLQGDWLYEWGGALRWLVSATDARKIRDIAQGFGGHATLFRAPEDRDNVFHPLPANLLRIHRQLKRAFDPKGILNPGRMYPEF